MAESRILAVVSNPEAAKAYSEALTEIGVTFDLADSIEKMEAMVMDHAYNGLLIDIVTLVRSTKEEKVIAYDCMNLFPVLRVTWDPKRRKIKLSPLEQSFSPNTEATLRFFVESRCSSFAARTLRRDKRRPLNLNLLFSTEESFPPQKTWRSFTVNVSQGGVFLHTLESFAKESTLWLRILELADQPAIAARVCWSLEWGGSRNIPGVGLKFIALDEGQERALRKLLNS